MCLSKAREQMIPQASGRAQGSAATLCTVELRVGGCTQKDCLGMTSCVEEGQESAQNTAEEGSWPRDAVRLGIERREDYGALHRDSCWTKKALLARLRPSNGKGEESSPGSHM